MALSAACFQCLSASSILSSHGMSQNVGVSYDDFSILCPALLHQIDDGACIVHEGAAAHGERGTPSGNFTDCRWLTVGDREGGSSGRSGGHLGSG